MKGNMEERSINPMFGVIVNRRPNEMVPQNGKIINILDISLIRRLRMINWVPQEDVWVLRKGSYLLCAFTVLSGSLTILNIRRFLQLQNQRLPTTLFGGLIVPVLLNGTAGEKYITSTILEGLYNCPLCMELRGSVLQAMFGSIVPLVLSFFICIPAAKLEKTYPVPKLTEFYKYFDIIKLALNRGKYTFLTLGVLNFFYGGLISNRMMECNKRMDARDEYVYQKLSEISTSSSDDNEIN